LAIDGASAGYENSKPVSEPRQLSSRLLAGGYPPKNQSLPGHRGTFLIRI